MTSPSTENLDAYPQIFTAPPQINVICHLIRLQTNREQQTSSVYYLTESSMKKSLLTDSSRADHAAEVGRNAESISSGWSC